MVYERAIPVQNRNCSKPFHYVYPCDSQPTTEPKVLGSNPLSCTYLLPPETPLASLVLLYEVCTYLALACVSACPPGKEKGTAVGFD